MPLIPINLGTLTSFSGNTSAAGAVTVTTLTSGNSYFLFQNISPVDMYVGIGTTPTVSTGIFLTSGGSIEYTGTFLPTGTVQVITAGTATVQPFTCLVN
jgi:hypothetical protein